MSAWPDGEPLLTSEQMAELDRRTIDLLGVPPPVLMECAAWACVQELLARWPERIGDGVAVFVGPGNNGGDGLAIARRLHLLGVPTSCRPVAPPASAGCVQQDELARAVGVPRAERIHAAGVVVDALFGTGLTRDLSGPFAEAVAAMEALGAPVLAVDVPSGVNGTTGAVLGSAPQAACTVTFGALKRAHFTSPARGLCGDVVQADIGVPMGRWPEVIADAPRLLDRSVLEPLASRPPAAHKGSFGHLLVVAGASGTLGAARLAAEAGLRAGAGLVTLAVPAGGPADSLAELAPEVMVQRVEGEGGAFSAPSVPAVLALAATRSAVAVGPGIGTREGTRAFARALWAELPTPAVFDADGLNAIAPAGDLRPGGPRAVTPHPGELRRLLPGAGPDRVEQVRELARRLHAVALLKGAGTLIARPDGATWLNPTGNPGMATAGSGDVLTGVLGALLARGCALDLAACAGAFWHGLAGDQAAEAVGQPSLLAGQISAALGPAWQARASWAHPATRRPER